MYVCIVYDISTNRLRLRVAKWCLRIGLQRLQRSVFVGAPRPRDLAELESGVRPLLPATDQFAVLSLDKNTYQTLLRGSTAARLKDLDKPLVIKVL